MDTALIAEACTRTAVVWVRTVASPRNHLAWHVWHENAVHVVYGVGEQSLPMLTGQVEVVVPSKDSGARLVTFVAQADLLPSGSPAWLSAADALSAARLNTRDPQRQRERWSTAALITRLTPSYLVSAGPGDDGTPAGRMSPPETAAATVGAHRPWHLRGRAGARRAGRRPTGG
jgi:hypothetical protein